MMQARDTQPVCFVKPLRFVDGERRCYEGFLQPFALHSHSHYVIGLVRQGERRLECNGVSYTLAPGDVIVFNPGDVHGCVQSSDEFFSYESFVLLEDAFDSQSLAGPVLKCSAVREAFVLFSQAMAEAQGKEDVNTAIRALWDALRMKGNDGSPAPHAPSRGSNHEAALRAYAHLRGHSADPAPVSELAAREGIASCALIRAYKREFSITPSQHLLSMRIDCARELLARGMKPVDVAVYAGFSDQAHLTRAFKQRIGSTPAAYREMVAKER